MKRLFFYALFAFVLTSCGKDPVPGCTDSYALTFNPRADLQDNSCEYSTVIFYIDTDLLENGVIAEVEVVVNGDYIGTSSKYWTNSTTTPPCHSQGLVKYKIRDGEQVDWNAHFKVLTLFGWENYTTVGSVQADPNEECIPINVLR